ncbi:glyceraldehyde-3-phosphate ferredoxin oxidoreductase [Balnearium lithotrophicum]|uniref:Glyceraldehyde-3-phosphate ferredoxin oxidoreductase n=1 Tax=Balnearium lithotrophicum TaxID=223788 RepID=A0A521D506_9BACT|nr:aldehyde ferredoxin oxidoreductase N-terminal domain-containing protein [Balnearium lithotrophicum]SMO66759.1 glyceraldehyde-3-phosphate ferredoxin oxidoreductase [Balnearium lithotrophicum]
MEFKTLEFDLSNERVIFKPFEKEGIYGVIDYGIYLHKNVLKSYKFPPYDKKNAVVVGIGPFAGSVLPGSHRLTFFFRSPLYGTLYPSTMGGAAYTFLRTGIDIISITGRSEKPAILVINGSPSNVSVSIEFVEEELLYKIWKNYKEKEGVYAFSHYLLDRFSDLFDGKKFRMACVGPAAYTTNYASIFSQDVRDGKFVEGAEDWAARGGGGSVLARAHNVVGIVFGGNWEGKRFKALDLSNYDFVKKLFSEVYDKPLFKVIAEKTEKYRYNPKLKTGGTFGGDYLSEKDKTPVLNWQIAYMDRGDREKLYRVIEEFYVKVFNSESIETKKWTTCGEPCPAVCKKVREGYKTDYEPYNANGPLSGSFWLKASDRAVKKVDSLGFDAIEFGGVAAWIFEVVHRGMLKPEEVGISDKPDFDVSSILNDPVRTSEKNADLLCQLAEKVAYADGDIPKLIGLGKRRASEILDEKFKDRLPEGKSFKDFAVFVPLGKKGEVNPTMYWAMGNFIPLPVQGKYWTYYKFGVFPEPEELAEKIVESSVGEYWYDNVGWCRFHRRWMRSLASVECELSEGKSCNVPVKWTKSVVELLFLRAYGEKLNAEEHGKKVLAELVDYALKVDCYPVFPDSERVVDLIVSASKEFKGNKWLEKFSENKIKFVREYISRTLEEYSRILDVNWNI